MEEFTKEIELSTEEKEVEKRKLKIKNFFFGWIKDNYDKTFLIVLTASLVMGLWFFLISKGQPVWYDSANFLSTAKKLVFGLDHVNDVWYYRRGFMWVLISALFFKIGLGEIGIQFVGIFFYMGLILVSYLLISKMFNKKLGLIVSFLMTFSWLLLFFVGRCMTDIPGTFFLTLALLFFWKGYVLKEGNKFLYWAGFIFGIAALTRFQLMMFLLPLFIYLFIDKKFKLFKDKSLWIAIAIFLATISPHLISYSIHYNNFFTDILTYYLGIGAVEANIASSASTITFSNYFDYIKDLPYILTTPLFILFLIGTFIFFSNLIIGIDKIGKNKEIQKRFFIFLWIIFPLIALGRITGGLVEQRYALPTFPFLFLLIAFAIDKIDFVLVKKINIKKLTATFLIIVGLSGLIIPGVIFAKDLTEFKKSSYEEVKEAALWLKENSQESEIILSNSIPYFTYYAERSCYGINPNQTIFEENVSSLDPSFYMISSFEGHEPWMYEYPVIHNQTLEPIKIIYNSQQPVVIIYKFIK